MCVLHNVSFILVLVDHLQDQTMSFKKSAEEAESYIRWADYTSNTCFTIALILGLAFVLSKPTGHIRCIYIYSHLYVHISLLFDVSICLAGLVAFLLHSGLWKVALL